MNMDNSTYVCRVGWSGGGGPKSNLDLQVISTIQYTDKPDHLTIWHFPICICFSEDPLNKITDTPVHKLSLPNQERKEQDSGSFMEVKKGAIAAIMDLNYQQFC